MTSKSLKWNKWDHTFIPNDNDLSRVKAEERVSGLQFWGKTIFVDPSLQSSVQSTLMRKLESNIHNTQRPHTVLQI